MDWQPIETAPKDGGTVLLWCAPTDPYRPGVRLSGAAMVGWYDEEAKAPYKWFTIDGGYHQDLPTHWMPLPAPPEE